MTSSSEALRKRVEAVLDMAVMTVSSLTESFQSGTSFAVVGKETDYQDEASDIPEDSGRSTAQESKLLHAETSKLATVDMVEG